MILLILLLLNNSRKGYAIKQQSKPDVSLRLALSI